MLIRKCRATKRFCAIKLFFSLNTNYLIDYIFSVHIPYLYVALSYGRNILTEVNLGKILKENKMFSRLFAYYLSNRVCVILIRCFVC